MIVVGNSVNPRGIFKFAQRLRETPKKTAMPQLLPQPNPALARRVTVKCQSYKY